MSSDPPSSPPGDSTCTVDLQHDSQKIITNSLLFALLPLVLSFLVKMAATIMSPVVRCSFRVKNKLSCSKASHVPSPACVTITGIIRPPNPYRKGGTLGLMSTREQRPSQPLYCPRCTLPTITPSPSADGWRQQWRQHSRSWAKTTLRTTPIRS